ncbi:MAG: OmpH family outer membrane protein [Proteobacteria bacterium]|nr:OmpH family outer membrane protein [Pseudomonadota bacterium]
MAKICRLMLLPVLLLSAGSAFAEMKIAVVNVQRAIGESNEAKAMIAKLETDVTADNEAVKKLNSEITQMQEKFVKDGEVMSDAEKRRIQKELEDKNTEYQFLANKLQKVVNERQQEILGQMAPKLDAVLKDIIAKQTYDLVIHRQNVLYVDPKYDITAQVTEQLNLKK